MQRAKTILPSLVIAAALTALAALPARAQETPRPPTATAKTGEPKAAEAKAPPLGADPTGLAVMQRRETYTLGKTEIADLDIRIEAARQFDKGRRLMRYVKREDGLEKLLVRFEEPPGLRWLAALTIEVPDGDDDQWLYLPDIRKVKRVSRSERTESFAGTGFAFEDLRSEALEAHTYNLVGKQVLQGRPAYEIEAKPITGHVRALQGYSKRHIFVDAERFVEMKIDFYDEDGKLLKTQENTDWKPVKTIFRPYRVRMKEHQRDRVTWIQFRSWTVNEPLAEGLFTTREMAREDH